MIVYTDEYVDQSFDISRVPAGSSVDARTKVTVRKHEDTGKVTLLVQALRRGRNVNGHTWSRWVTHEWHSIRKVAAGYAVLTSKLPRSNKPMTRRLFKGEVYPRRNINRLFQHFDLESLKSTEEVYPYAQKYSDWRVNWTSHDSKFIAAFAGAQNAAALTRNLFGKKRSTPELIAAVNDAESLYPLALAWAFRGLVPDENLIPLLGMQYEGASSEFGTSKIRKHLKVLSPESCMNLVAPAPHPHWVREVLDYHPLFMQRDGITSWRELSRRSSAQNLISRHLAIYNITPTASFQIPRSLARLNGYETFGYGYKMVLVENMEDLMSSGRVTYRIGGIIQNMMTQREWYGQLYSGQRLVGNFRIDLVNKQLSSLLDVYSEPLDEDIQREVVDAVTMYDFTANNFVGMAECLDD